MYKSLTHNSHYAGLQKLTHNLHISHIMARPSKTTSSQVITSHIMAGSAKSHITLI